MDITYKDVCPKHMVRSGKAFASISFACLLSYEQTMSSMVHEEEEDVSGKDGCNATEVFDKQQVLLCLCISNRVHIFIFAHVNGLTTGPPQWPLGGCGIESTISLYKRR